MAITFVAGYIAAVYVILSALKHVTRTPPAPLDDDIDDELADAWERIVARLEAEDA